MAIEMPARVASRKPACSSLSANTTVSFRPHLRNEVLIRREISFFFSALLMLRERQALGQDLGQQRAADGGVDELGLRRELAGVLVLDLLGQAHR